jgi:hypothetical protein
VGFKKAFGRERPLNAADYEMVGVLGKLTSSIGRWYRRNELLAGGMRRSAPARSDDGGAIEKGPRFSSHVTKRVSPMFGALKVSTPIFRQRREYVCKRLGHFRIGGHYHLFFLSVLARLYARPDLMKL